ncbi:AraC family transcriptional regulator [Lysinibacter sp. HNR]|uniref:AraC family transcriptional regulator n=1 Tax=Lysinibacter sp. HNR TaxID=3031408 RepID=UPI0024357930|nr:AraC family transcriptional regulator [Lysinibacter sp. HNR]WGD36527.1 AraC family transcriptional regulator [Lysinibacter sp. HNR]
MRPSQWVDYEERFDVVVSHIYDNLHRPLDLPSLADVVGLSAQHWHRVFTSAFGESIVALVKRLRMQKASHLLANSSIAVSRIAVECGYPSVQSFTRAFSATYGMPPARYRNEGSHSEFRRARAQFDPNSFSVDIREIASIDCLSVSQKGPYLTIGQAFTDLAVWYSSHGLDPDAQRYLGVYGDDPTAKKESDLISHACFVRPQTLVGAPVPVAPDAAVVRELTIEGGTYAVLRYRGPYADMRSVYEWLFGCWVMSSGYALANRPLVEDYLNKPKDTAPASLETEMWLPLQDR